MIIFKMITFSPVDVNPVRPFFILPSDILAPLTSSMCFRVRPSDPFITLKYSELRGMTSVTTGSAFTSPDVLRFCFAGMWPALF